ncbi:MAG: hypothetical protein HZR80_20525 [Candidatus Heimdallarchaeota archaeon]
MVDEKVQTAFKNIEDYITQLESKLKGTEEEIAAMKDVSKKLENEKTSAAERLKKMEQDMVKLSSVYEELKGQKDVEINLHEVMKLYVILTEQVLDGSSHIKLLTLMHGAKQYMTKTELSKASGIQPAATLRTIFDLRNNGLINYDENNETVTLIQRLFD